MMRLNAFGFLKSTGPRADRFFDLRNPLFVFPALKLLLHAVTWAGYGVFRDELYYLACADRPAAGYVDHPPLSIWLLAAVRAVFGEALWALRAPAALAGAAAVFLVGLTAKRLGAGVWGQSVAMVAMLSVPVFWFTGHIYSMNAFEPLIWCLVAYLWLGRETVSDQAPDAPDDKPAVPPWGLLGLVLGLGLLNKISVLWLGAGLAVALIATPDRRLLRTPGPWLCGALSFLLFSPFLVWQGLRGWPMAEFIGNATSSKMQSVSAWQFILKQVDMLGAPTAMAMALGFGALAAAGGRRRSLALIYGTIFLILLLNGSSRASYLAPAYTFLAAGFGAACETWMRRLQSRPILRPTSRWATSRWATLRWAIPGVLAAHGLVALPFALPILPVPTYLAYAEGLGVEAGTEERKEIGLLPQHYADMFGWQEKVEAARRVFDGLSPADQAVACLAAQNYGVAGALEAERLFPSSEPDVPLPPVLSGHNNYWLWLPPGCSGEVLIVLGDDRETLEAAFASVEAVDKVDCELCMPYEDDQTVWLVRNPLLSIEEIWPQVKNFS